MKNVKFAALASLSLAAAMAGAQGISVTVDGQPVQFSGAGPRFVNGRVMVPLRGVFEQLGATVDWNPATQKVEAANADRDVSLHIGRNVANVNGQRVQMDTPPMVIAGSTMVPIRFLSEALGASVDWNGADQVVMISTGGNGYGQRLNRGETRNDRPMRVRHSHSVTLDSATVIPVTLNNGLSSNGSMSGDKFTATVQTSGDDAYGPLPAGSEVEGKVLAARPKRGNDPGMLELAFNRVRLPDGRAYAIDGSLIGLDNSDLERNGNGVLIARGQAKDERMVYAGYGAGAGLVVGLLTKRPLEGTVIGGLLGYIVGGQKNDRDTSNVRLPAGTQLGVRLNHDVVMRVND